MAPTKNQILDCTLRDGGYYNNWNFETSTVERYLQVMQQTSVDWVEIGFRFIPQSSFVGPYGYSTDAWIGALKIPEGLHLAVMCNAKDLLANGDPASTVCDLFSIARESPIELVRIAAHFEEVSACLPAIETLCQLGYRIGFNLMQASGRSNEELLEKVAELKNSSIEVLYFADSLGCMGPDEVMRTVTTIRQAWDKAIGFHAHDNMGQALANAHAAKKAGATWIDATVLGMGRGGGNLRLEYWLLELDRSGSRSASLDLLLQLVVSEFKVLQDRYGWGPSVFYHLSALYGVHPTYVQEMLACERYNGEKVIDALRRLGQAGARGYSADQLHQAIGSFHMEGPGQWDARGWLQGQTVVLVGPGEAGREHLEGLRQLQEKHSFPLLCINSNPWIPEELVTAWVACNPERLAVDADYYAERSGILIAPESTLGEKLREVRKQWVIKDYGLKVVSGNFDAGSITAIIPSRLAALYGIALANAAGCSRIYMVGFDGYGINDPRHQEMNEGLQIYYNAGTYAPLVAITPTNLNIEQSSLYQPEL